MADATPGKRLGRLPPHDPVDAPRLMLGPALRPDALPPTPPVIDWIGKVTNWPMYANDQVGCCIPEGTAVQADGVQRAYRARYDGPVLRVEFTSGQILTVTPNHAVLTPRGFVRARFLKKGDYAVRARRPEVLEGCNDFNQSPAPIEEIFAALSRRGTTTRQRAQLGMSTCPDDFHGDARFFDGDVDVVDPLGLLKSEHNAALSKPYSKSQVLSAGQLESDLHRRRSALQRAQACGSAALGRVRSLGELGSFGRGHAGVAHAKGFPLWPDSPTGLYEQAPEPVSIYPGLACEYDPSFPRVVAVKERHQPRRNAFVAAASTSPGTVSPRRELVASALHPPLDGSATDAKLASNLIQGHPGLVQADRVVDVYEYRYHGYVYDLSTARRWYVSNGIVVHNCVFAMIGHAIQAATCYGQGCTVTPTEADVLGAYTDVTGYNPAAGPPGRNPTDRGTVIQDALSYWRHVGVGGHRIAAYAEVDVANRREVEAALYLFGHLMVGLDVPAVAMRQFDRRWPWMAKKPDGGILGGHAVSFGYDAAVRRPTVITWGRPQRMTTAFWAKYVREAWIVITPDWISSTGTSPNGVDLATLDRSFRELTGEQLPF